MTTRQAHVTAHRGDRHGPVYVLETCGENADGIPTLLIQTGDPFRLGWTALAPDGTATMFVATTTSH